MNEIIIMIAITNNKLLKWWGVYIYSKNGSIDFNNCTIYNNTIQHAGVGVLILPFGNGSIDCCDCTIQINSAWAKGEGVHIYSNGSDSFKFSSWIYNNTAYLGSGMLQQLAFFFTNVSFHFNKVASKYDVYQAALVLFNVKNVIFDQIEVNNHNTTGFVSFSGVITLDKNNTFESKLDIYGGGIALYKSSQLLPNIHIFCLLGFGNTIVCN